MSLVRAMVKLGTITYNKFGDIPSIKGVANMMMRSKRVTTGINNYNPNFYCRWVL